MNKPSFIPKAVTDLLRSKWDHSPDYSAFRTAAIPDQLMSPSWHIHTVYTESVTAFRLAEARALHLAGAFGPHSAIDDGRVIVNEHASHALVDFLGESSAAWKKYQDRLRKIPVREPR